MEWGFKALFINGEKSTYFRMSIVHISIKREGRGGNLPSFFYLFVFACRPELWFSYTNHKPKLGKKFSPYLYWTFSHNNYQIWTEKKFPECISPGLRTFPSKRSDEAIWLHPLRFLSDFLQLGLNHDLIF